MWYQTEKEAKEACEWKKKEYGKEFYVLKDTEGDFYWAQRKIEDERKN